jgi:N6-L-threonylcarbamoyladenine synthase
MTQAKIQILAIDTSCDDTSVAILENDCVLANIVSSQIDVHQEWGGVVPALAKRAHQQYIASCIHRALKRAKVCLEALDAIAITYGPGLAPSLEVGLHKARELATEYHKKLIAVNHMEGHLLSPLLKNSKGRYYSKIHTLPFPCLGMTISGGHTEIVWLERIGEYKILGKTMDDAAGEAFDKIARMLGLGYPGGAVVEAFAERGDRTKYNLPRPMQKNKGYDFSFSGLKTACLYQTNDLKKELGSKFAQIIPDYCASLQEAIVDSLLTKLKKAAKDFSPKTILVGGGVSVNRRLRSKFRCAMRKQHLPIYFPHKKFCMDNAAMIGLCAYFKYQRGEFVEDIRSLDRVPYLSIEACR